MRFRTLQVLFRRDIWARFIGFGGYRLGCRGLGHRQVLVRDSSATGGTKGTLQAWPGLGHKLGYKGTLQTKGLCHPFIPKGSLTKPDTAKALGQVLVDRLFRHRRLPPPRLIGDSSDHLTKPQTAGDGRRQQALDISGDMGLVSAGRINKNTPLLTTPSHTSKSSTMDISSHIFQIDMHRGSDPLFHGPDGPCLV